MTDAPTRPIPQAVSAPRRLHALPARWRITAWIILSTVFTLTAVGVLGRSLLLAGVEQGANSGIEQEAAEFTHFVEDGGATGEEAGRDASGPAAFSSPEGVLQSYIDMQSVHAGEVILGVVDGTVVASGGEVSGLADSTFSLADQRGLVHRMLSERRVSGVEAETDAGPMRWGRVDFELDEESGSLLVARFTEQDRALVDESVARIAWVALVGVLLSSGVAWLVAGQILAPVREVTRVARGIGEHDLTARVPVEGNDDVAAMAATFNQMLDRLEEVYATQQRFVDDAGHELRTPITVVRGHLELLSDDPEERRATLRLVSDELARMSRIVTDLLVLARAQQPDFVTTSPCDTATLTLDIEAKAQALGDRRWQLMEVAEGIVVLDPQRITQAVLQLAANAVQVTDTGDRIRIGSRFEGGGESRRLRIWVQDSGPGVAAADAERIFERFVRGGAADGSRGDTAGPAPRRGSGLGLAIVRAITDGHGGSAWLDSVPGEGATFGVEVPAPEDPPEAAAPERADAEGTSVATGNGGTGTGTGEHTGSAGTAGATGTATDSAADALIERKA